MVAFSKFIETIRKKYCTSSASICTLLDFSASLFRTSTISTATRSATPTATVVSATWRSRRITAKSVGLTWPCLLYVITELPNASELSQCCEKASKVFLCITHGFRLCGCVPSTASSRFSKSFSCLPEGFGFESRNLSSKTPPGLSVDNTQGSGKRKEIHFQPQPTNVLLSVN